MTKIIVLSLILINLAVSGAGAAPVSIPAALHRPNLHEEASYILSWNGVRVGKFHVLWTENGERYRADFTLKTASLARIFVKQNRAAYTEGRIVKDGENVRYIPEIFTYHVKYRHKEKDVKVRYDAAGNVTATEAVPPENRANRPEVPQEQQNTALDPLTALQRYFAGIMELAALKASAIVFSAYDGRRLVEISFTPLSERQECGEHCFTLQAKRAPLAGFTAKEIEKYHDGEPNMFIEVIPSRSWLPQKAWADTEFGPVTVERQK